MSDNLDKVIEKIKKLLALSTSSNAHEAAAAAALANKLLDEHRLSECDLEVQDETHSEPVEEDPDYIYQTGKITHWRRDLMRCLVSHYGCSCWNDWTRDGGRKISRYKVVGKRSDIGIVKYMFSWITLECQRLSAQEVKGMGRVFIASYCEGFVNGIAEQLKASRVQAQATATSSAIVKLDERANLAREEMYRMHNNLRTRTVRSYAQSDGNAFSIGQQRGKSMHLGAAIGSGGTRLLNK